HCRRPASAGPCSISRPVRAEAERSSPLPERPRSKRPGAWTLLRLLELLAVDHDAASDLSDRLAVLRRRDVQAHFIAGLERILAPASAGLGDGIPCFENPARDVAAVVLGIHLHQDV